MVALNLDKFLSGHAFAFVFIFSRLGSALMLFPGIGESYVSPRIRLLFAFSLTFLMMEPLMGRLPQPPSSIPTMVALIAYEVMIGLFFGTLLRLLMSTLETTGTIIGLQTGLSNATILNPTLASQSPLPSAFLSVAGVTLLFITGLDHMLLRCIIGLYDVFPPGGELMPGDMAQSVIQIFNKSFVIGIELAMPFFVMGLLMYIALGLIQKLLPQIQLFLVLLPVQIWGGLTLLGITTAGILTLWLKYVDQSLGTLVAQ